MDSGAFLPILIAAILASLGTLFGAWKFFGPKKADPRVEGEAVKAFEAAAKLRRELEKKASDEADKTEAFIAAEEARLAVERAKTLEAELARDPVARANERLKERG